MVRVDGGDETGPVLLQRAEIREVAHVSKEKSPGYTNPNGQADDQSPEGTDNQSMFPITRVGHFKLSTLPSFFMLAGQGPVLIGHSGIA